MPPILQTHRRPVGSAVGTDTGLEDVETSGCYFAGYVARWVSGASILANDREMASDLSRREASGAATPADITGSHVTIATRSSLGSAGASRTLSIRARPGGTFVCARRKAK